MNPNVGLHAASGLVSFLLRSTLEWGVCLLLVRIAGTAKTRFNVLLAMLMAFLGEWGWMAWSSWQGVASHPGASALMSASAPRTAERIAVAAPDVTFVSYAMLGLLGIYLVGLTWKLVSAIAVRFRLMRAMRHRMAPSSSMEAVFQEIAADAGLNRCELWVLPGIASPATLGWIRPRVIVPPACEIQDEAELEAVFWHELKHIERRDSLWNGVMRATQNLLWFHPAVHQAVKELQAQRELACDAAVVEEHPYSRDIYASCLLRFARAGELVTTIEMASGADLLKARVMQILADTPEPSLWVNALRIAANFALVGTMIATVPALNILFAAQVGIPLSKVPLEAIRNPTLHLRVRPHEARLAISEPSSVTQKAQPATASSVEALSAPVVHDEALAAEHRAGAGILTESSGMDSVPTNPGATRGITNGTTGHNPTVPSSSSSWGSVAITAAEQMVPLMGDRDGDRR